MHKLPWQRVFWSSRAWGCSTTLASQALPHSSRLVAGQLPCCCCCCYFANDQRLPSVPMSCAQTTMGFNPALLPCIPNLTTIFMRKILGNSQHRSSCCAVDYNVALKFARPYPARTVNSELERYHAELLVITRQRRRKARHAYHRGSGITKRYRLG